ncbi:rRNA methyltransferase [Candidatus Aerophobetes bacterium]|uniref:rRNA methyltransferase n=1 Tax=Aerophobetes bacterium TaxID=2030807 RepID=A0A2A4X3F2_UNCAE|nr:MAG: rRNA methyltransferase [Candidatus Aerophobetes bacterium]
MQNQSVKDALKLKDRRKREETKTFLVEGYRECLRAWESSWKFEKLFFCPSLFLDVDKTILVESIKKTGAELIELAPHVFEKLSYRDRPDGFLGVAIEQKYSVEDLKKRWSKKEKEPVLLLAEAIEKPGNLGSILRSADAAGVDGIILCDERVDVFNPNVVRSSLGTLFSTLIVTLSIDAALDWLKKEKIDLVATSPDAKELYTATSLNGAIAIAMGSEKLGLSERCLKQADKTVYIPMLGRADSLNVAAAATLMLFEVVRQRGVST